MLNYGLNLWKTLINSIQDWGLNVAIVTLALLAPIHSMMMAAGALIVADMITGIWAAKKRQEEIKSAGFRRTINKMLTFQIAIITGFIAEKWLLGGLLPISNIVAGVIGLTEIKSIIENLDTVYGSSIFQEILKKLQSKNDNLPQ